MMVVGPSPLGTPPLPAVLPPFAVPGPTTVPGCAATIAVAGATRHTGTTGHGQATGHTGTTGIARTTGARDRFHLDHARFRDPSGAAHQRHPGLSEPGRCERVVEVAGQIVPAGHRFLPGIAPAGGLEK